MIVSRSETEPMLRLRMILPLLLLVLLFATAQAQDADVGLPRVESPNGATAMMVIPRGGANGGLRYIVEFHGKRVIDESVLGLKLEGQPPLGPGMKIGGAKSSQHDETYTIPAGKTSSVRDHYNAIHAEFADDSDRKLVVEMRAYDDGIAFRMIVPEQGSQKQVRVEKELTEFRFTKDAITYPLVLSSYQTPYEDEYQRRVLSGLHKDWLIGLPLLVNVPGVAWVGMTEADIENYAGMYLKKGDATYALRAQLSPRIDHPNVAVETDAPVTTPWRVLMLGDEPGRLVESNIVLNLNPPSKIADTSWIKAGKTSWDWWSGDYANNVPFKPGMNTETLKHYIDFSAASGFAYMLIDAGWAVETPDVAHPDNAMADITKPNPAVDLPELLRYAKEKGVKLWLWAHWTSVDKYMEQAFPLFEQWGVAGVKIDFMNRDDQQMVAWYRKVVDLAAQHHLMIDYHGAFKPDGLRRTYPNLITREGVMGKEWLKWTARVGPVHDTTLPFARMLAGPLDYTPGAFGNATREDFVARRTQPMGLGTRAHELALYVVLESELQMVSDYPEHYAGQKDFDFIKQVPATWDEVRVLNGRPTENITVARRSGKDWYIGAITNWEPRTVKVPLDFLGEGKYTAEIYADADDAGTVATHTQISSQQVDKGTVLEVKMVSGGGQAVWIHQAQ